MGQRNHASNMTPTTLNAAITAGATSCVVPINTGVPAVPYTALIDDGTASFEAVTVTATAGTGPYTLTITRGVDGTTAQSHNASATFRHGITAQDVQEPNGHLNATPAIAADQDTATGIHHTLGAGATQAAAGNHTHTGQVVGGAVVATSESSAGNTYSDLTTVGPSVTLVVPASGKVLISIAADVSGTASQASLAVDVSGASTITAATNDTNGFAARRTTAAALETIARTFILTGLTAGSSTFVLKYKSANTVNTTWSSRTLAVVALP